MALTPEQAMGRLKALIASAFINLSYDNAYWMLAIMYEKGQQWGYVSPVSGVMRVQYLRNLTDPQRRDVRVTMNKIGELVRQIKAEINPTSFRGAAYKPASGGVEDRLIAGLGSRLMKQHLEDIHAIQVYRDANMARCVLGTCGIRRTLRMRSERMYTRIVAGNIFSRPVREFSIGWARIYPWEILRDPSAISLRPEEDEQIICHYKPRTVQWVKERFPQVEIKSQSTMGELMTFNRQIRAASGMVGNQRVSNSKEPGVMVYECYFREGNSWPYVLFAFGDPANSTGSLEKIWFGPSAFYGMPLHLLHYDNPIQMPWSRGIPHILMAAQDMSNLGWTWILRTQAAGVGTWIMEKGTLERPREAFSPRVDRFCEWDRSGASIGAVAKEPHWVKGPEMSASALQIISSTPEWMTNALNLSPVQKGITSKRGESSKAIEAKLRQAGVPLDDLRRDDELMLAGLLQATLYDMTNRRWIRQDIVGRLLGPDVPKDQVRLLTRKGTRDSVGSVTVHPTTLRPKTKADTREQFTDLSAQGVIQPIDAQWEMYLQNGEIVNTGMARAIQKQEDEIARMVAGAEILPTAGDHHEYHLRTLQEFIDSPQWHNLPETARDRINHHFALHKATQIEMSQIEALGLGPAQEQGPSAQGSPPAMAETPALVPGGAAAPPELAVA